MNRRYFLAALVLFAVGVAVMFLVLTRAALLPDPPRFDGLSLVGVLAILGSMLAYGKAYGTPDAD